MTNQTRYEKFKGQSLPELLDELGRNSAGNIDSADTISFLQSLISVRTAEMVSAKLSEAASVIGRSANKTTETLDHSTEILKSTVENSSNFLIAALRVDTQATTASAGEIQKEIRELVDSLRTASRGLETAGNQSAHAARTLNRFTLFLAIGTILLFAAGCFQAWEMKRQVDIAERQLHVAEVQMQTHTADAPDHGSHRSSR